MSMRTVDTPKFLAMGWIAILLLAGRVVAHEGHPHSPQAQTDAKPQSADVGQTEPYARLWTTLIEHWPTRFLDDTISQAWREIQR